MIYRSCIRAFHIKFTRFLPPWAYGKGSFAASFENRRPWRIFRSNHMVHKLIALLLVLVTTFPAMAEAFIVTSTADSGPGTLLEVKLQGIDPAVQGGFLPGLHVDAIQQVTVYLLRTQGSHVALARQAQKRQKLVAVSPDGPGMVCLQLWLGHKAVEDLPVSYDRRGATSSCALTPASRPLAGKTKKIKGLPCGSPFLGLIIRFTTGRRRSAPAIFFYSPAYVGGLY